MLHIRKNGITTVSIGNRQDIINAAIGISKILENVPELSALVVALMTKEVTLDELGIEKIDTRHLDNQESFETALSELEDTQPAEAKDIPNFVKRSIKGKNDE
jgi:hypothetical protein